MGEGSGVPSAAVEEFLTTARRQPAGILIEGESGIGKTALWTGTVDRASRSGFLVLTAHTGGRIRASARRDRRPLQCLGPRSPRPAAPDAAVGRRRGSSETALRWTDRGRWQRVAELAASGITNRDVAVAIFISVKTVETNLTRAYRKLGIRSRAQLGQRLRHGGEVSDGVDRRGEPL